MRTYYVYIMASISGVLYTGVTNNIKRRVGEHKSGVSEKSFTRRYRVKKLVYYEMHISILQAIAREKQIKKWNRSKRVALIEKGNPKWQDLSYEWYA